LGREGEHIYNESGTSGVGEPTHEEGPHLDTEGGRPHAEGDSADDKEDLLSDDEARAPSGTVRKPGEEELGDDHENI
jgi:hypothetical protein